MVNEMLDNLMEKTIQIIFDFCLVVTFIILIFTL